MQQFYVALAALISSVAALPSLAARDSDLSPAILANITTLETDIQTLNNSLNAEGDGAQYSFFELLAIEGAANTLSSDINSTTATANASSVWTQPESAAVYNASANGLAPSIYSLLDNFAAHYPGFKSGGIDGTVKNSLVAQREASRELGNALAAKGVAPYAGEGATVSSNILAAFDQVIATYSQ